MTNIALIHPPLDDPTIPYHSTAYLAGHLRHNGFTDVSMRDINVEFVNYCLETGVSDGFYQEAERRRAVIEKRSTLSYQDQEQYYSLLSAPKYDLQGVAQGLRDLDSFLDYESYVSNVRQLNTYFGLLGALSYPMTFENLVPRTKGRLSFYTFSDLLNEELANRICYPMVRFFEERLIHDSSFAERDLYGISIVYDHQLVHALHLARLLKRAWPGKRVILGGTAISQLYKHLLHKEQMKCFFDVCNAIVVGEGETAICEIAGCDKPLWETSNLTNTITYDRRRDHLSIPSIRYENVQALGAPVYNHRWDLYLSPLRGINYSPTRGCYWNRCTFCDYGLNTDKPTSPWRERKIDQVISDLYLAKRDHGVRYVYFAVDVIAPAYLERLSDAIVDSGLDIRWGGEIRLENIFTLERCRKMVGSGCVCVSFGMESGSQRILDLIDKGTRIDNMAQTMKNFSSAGIAVQLMAFKDFPTETQEERLQTEKFIRDNSDYWAAGGIGNFLLTGTSIVAKNPSKFGVTVMNPAGADMARAVAYQVDAEGSRKINSAEDADDSFDNSDSIFPSVLGRPWAGGTDSFHTMIYYDFHKQTFFKQHPVELPSKQSESLTGELLRCTVKLSSKLAKSTVDLVQLFANRAAFQAYLENRRNVPSEPTYQSFVEWEQDAIPAGSVPDRETFWLVTPSRFVQIDKGMYKLLHVLDLHRLPVDYALKGFPSNVQQKMLRFIVELQKRKFLIITKADSCSRANSSPAVYAVSQVRTSI